MAFHKEKDIQILFEVNYRILNLRRNRLQLSRRFIATGLFAAGDDSRPKKPRKKWKGGTGEYEVVRCGEAGHNIRNQTNLKGTTVGLLCRNESKPPNTRASRRTANATAKFHCLLQTIADLMSQVPAGSAVRQMAMRSWCIHFQQQDHIFLHRSYVFSRINEVLTQDESDQKAETTIEPSVSVLAASDILGLVS